MCRDCKHCDCPSECPRSSEHAPIQNELERQERMGHQSHGFLDLPIEIRNKIYYLLLACEKIFVPNTVAVDDEDFAKKSARYLQWHNVRDHFYRRRQRYLDYKRPRPPRYEDKTLQRCLCDSPCFALLKGVSRQVQAETEKVGVFLTNTVLLPKC